MNKASDVANFIASIRPSAKFVACNHSSEFIDRAANLGDGFYYVNLYDEIIDSNLLKSRSLGPILIHNTYLSSFAYNLLLCWMLVHSEDGTRKAEFSLDTLLKHNFKKFYAEQLLRLHGNVFSRAIFLETLLYEQECMVPVFASRSKDSRLDAMTTLSSQLMSSMVSFHELGHYYLEGNPASWNDMQGSYVDRVEPLLKRVIATYPAAFVLEFKCDVMAVVAGLSQYEAKAGRAFCLRAMAFAFSAYAVMFSLIKSADKTARDQRPFQDEVDFASIEKRHRDYNYSLGMDRDFIERATLMIELCSLLSAPEPLFSDGGTADFPLPATILQDLLGYISNLLDSADTNARAMSLLVAEALHDHPRGIDFLTLRSKTFSFGSGRNADGSLNDHRDV